MYFYQYILLAGFTCLFFNKETRLASLVFLSGWSVYLYATIGLGASSYYALSGSIELAIGFVLNFRYRVVSYISYLLIIVNIFGFASHEIKTQYEYYDIIYALLSVTQFLMLIIRANLNGVYRLPEQCWLVRLVNFDSCKARVIMYKNKTKKEETR